MSAEQKQPEAVEVICNGLPESVNMLSNGMVAFSQSTCIPCKAKIGAFDDVELDPRLVDNLKKCKIETPTLIQSHVLPILSRSQNLVISTQLANCGRSTGVTIGLLNNLLKNESESLNSTNQSVDENGKFCRHPAMVVVVPNAEDLESLETVLQTMVEGSPIKLCVNHEARDLKDDMQLLEGGCDLLVTTMRRLLEVVKHKVVSLEHTRLVSVEGLDKIFAIHDIVTIDEMVYRCFNEATERQTVISCGPINPQIKEFANSFLRRYVVMEVSGGCASMSSEKSSSQPKPPPQSMAPEPPVKEMLRVNSAEEKDDCLIQLLCQWRRDSRKERCPPALIYARDDTEVESLTKLLRNNGLPAMPLYTSDERKPAAVEKSFKAASSAVLVSTADGLRGCAMNHVQKVIHYDVPKTTIESQKRLSSISVDAFAVEVFTFSSFTKRPRSSLENDEFKDRRVLSEINTNKDAEDSMEKSFDLNLFNAPKAPLSRTGMLFDDFVINTSDPRGNLEDLKDLCDFAELSLVKELRESMLLSGYHSATKVQKYTIPIILSGLDLLAHMPRGCGFTIAYLISTLQRLISHANAVEQEQGGKRRRNGILGAIITYNAVDAECVYMESKKLAHGSSIRVVLMKSKFEVEKEGASGPPKCPDLLVASVEGMTAVVKNHLYPLDFCKSLVICDVDHVTQYGGSDDHHALQTIISAFSHLEDCQRIMFSTNTSSVIKNTAKQFLRHEIIVHARVEGSSSAHIQQRVVEVTRGPSSVTSQSPSNAKLDALFQLLILDELQKGKRPTTLIIVNQLSSVSLVKSKLKKYKCAVEGIEQHPKTEEEKKVVESCIANFKDQVVQVLIVTSAVIKSIDIPCSQHVLNFDLPTEISEYAMRIRHSGRGTDVAARATSFYDSSVDKYIAKDLISYFNKAKQSVPEWLKADDKFYGKGLKIPKY